jgi:hypothetical protein
MYGGVHINFFSGWFWISFWPWFLNWVRSIIFPCHFRHF